MYKITIWDYFSFVPWFYLAFVLIQTYEPFYRWLFAAALAIVGFAELFKLASRPWLTTYPFLARPHGARNCNCWNGGGDASGQPGFPSTHVALITFLLFSIFIHGIRTNTHYILVSMWGCYALTQIYFVGQSRLKKKCHSQLQVVAGGAFGISCAMLFSLTIAGKI